MTDRTAEQAVHALLSLSVAAEAAVVGAAMVSADAAHEVVRRLTPDHFAGHLPRLAFEAVAGLLADGLSVTHEAVYRRLLEAKKGDEIDGGPPALLAWLAERRERATTFDLADQVGVVREAAARRRFIAVSREQLRDAEAQLGPAADEAGRFADRLADLAAGADSEPPTIDVLAWDAIARLKQRQAERDDPAAARRLTTGFRDLDAVVPSLDAGMLVVVGGRPGGGKTAFVTAVCHAAADLRGRPVYLSSLEMDGAEIAERVLFLATGAPGHRLRAGQGTADDFALLEAAAGELAGSPFVVDDTRGLTVEQIVARARRAGRRFGGLALLAVDYAGLVEATAQRAGLREAMVHVTKRLKQAAGLLGCPVLLLAQLNRKLEEGKPRDPVLSDLKESGSLEQDADVVLLLWERPAAAYAPTESRIGVKIAKHRNGPQGEITLRFRKSCVRLENMPFGEF